jgi:tetratricopeptide (TPR) repeat protein
MQTQKGVCVSVAPQSAVPVEVFYSYSHKDEKLRDQLENHLALLKRKGIIKGWHDRRISAGQEWDGKINEHLNSADIILLLVSSDFLASNYCYDIEVTRAMERHEAREARVIPVILRPCDWQSAPFGKVQALPKDARPVTRWEDEDEAFLNIATGIRNVVEEIRSKHSDDIPPLTETVKPAPHIHIPDLLRVPFVARKDKEGNDIVERLKEELAPHKDRLISLWGAGGVGKTAIASEAARALSDAYDQRIVWVSADGREDFNLIALLDGIATQLGEVDLRKLALEMKKEQVSEVLRVAPTLVVLDNFETIAPEEASRCAEWLAQPALCSALITTRQRIEEAARNISVDTMLSDEAHDLLQRLIAEVHEPKAFANLDRDRVIGTAEANPLVLQWIVGQIDLAQDPEEVLNDLAHGEGTAAQRVFDRSFNLPQLDKGGRAALLALSLFVPSATRHALADVAGMGKDKDRKRFKEALKNLSSLWLIHATEDQRLTVEGLTRELTKARLSKDPRSKPFRQRFVSRLLRYADNYKQPTPSNYNALEIEKDNLLSAMDIALDLGDRKFVMQLMYTINYDGANGFLTVRGYWDEAIQRGEQALAAARHLRNEVLVGTFAHDLALAYQNRGELTKARILYDESLEIAKNLGDQSGMSRSLHQLAMLSQAQGNYAEARRLYNEGLEIDERLSHPLGIASSLHQLAMLSQDQGNYVEARRLYNESLEIAKNLSDQSGIAATLSGLGSVAQEQNDYAEARRLYSDSLEVAKKLGHKNAIAFLLHQLGTLNYDEKDFEEVENLLNESLSILRTLGNKTHIAECLESTGKLRIEQGRYPEAQALLDEALEIAKPLGLQFRIGSVKHSLGLLTEKCGDRASAIQLFSEALSIFEEIGAAKKEMARQSLERVEK